LVYKHQQNLKNIFSFTSEKITLNWLKIVLFSFLATYIVLYITGAWYLIENRSFYVNNINPIEFSYIGLTFFAFAFSFFGFRQLAVYSKKEETEEKPKYESSGLQESEIAGHLKALSNIMSKQKPYLNEKLTVSDLADMLKISRHHLTEILNEHLGKNFYTFVNEYRLEEVKQKLIDDRMAHFTILAIAYECGFNSKSSFNTLFKQDTGHTPSEYRKKFSENK
jgi:AraC-like DNA-binding protein